MSTQPKRVLLLLEAYAGYVRLMAEGILSYVRQHADWQILYDHVPQVSPALLQRHPEVDGIIVSPAAARFAELEERTEPIVAMRIPEDHLTYPGAMADNAAVGKLAFEYFESLGFKRFAFLGNNRYGFGRVRQEHFESAAEQAGRSVRSFNTELTTPEVNLVDWLKQLEKPVALFAANISLARLAAEVCRLANIHVPDEIAILGVDRDDLLCNLTHPPLSTIDHGMEKLGFECARMLDALMRDEAIEDEPIIIPPVGVIERQSTDILAVEDPTVREAVRYIRRHAIQGINVEDVIHNIPASRRGLEMQFRKLLDRTIYGEITRVRIKHAKRLLIETNLTIPQITASSGFNYATQFSTTFKKEVGMTPRAFRKEHHI